MTNAEIIEVAESIDNLWWMNVDHEYLAAFGRAIESRTLERAAEACEIRGYMVPAGAWGMGYGRAADDCADAVRALAPNASAGLPGDAESESR